MLRWEMRQPNRPLVATEAEVPELGNDEVLVRVVGSGICHTDLGFLYGGVRTRKAPPLSLGHEVSGIVEATGAAAREWRGQQVVVSAVIPCDECPACRRGRPAICPNQIFPGNDIHGGFATHVVVPARGLCPVPSDLESRCGTSLAELAVLADAITTPFEAARRAHLHEGDVAIYVGVGGVGGFGVQVARAMGAHVIAIDVDADRLKLAADHGASLVLDASELDAGALRDRIRKHLQDAKRPLIEWKIFETSGTKAGQEIAWRMLVHGAHLGVVGFTLDTASVRLSNLMALDARAEGNWGCPPDRYPEALDLVLHGKVEIGPYVERRPLREINRALEDLKEHRVKRRIVLEPEA